MIVISGALVLVALVLLVVGLVGQGLTFVYASIAVSLAAFVFLLLGILQRRGEPGAAPAPGAGSGSDRMPADDDREGVTVVPAPAAPPAPSAPPSEVSFAKPAPAEAPREPEPAAAQDDPEPPVEDDGELLSDVDEAELDEIDTTVLVVPGRPRYHIDGCRYLYGKDVEEVHVLDAREEGFTPCGVCKPDAVLVADLEALPVTPVVAAAPMLAPAAITPQSLLAPSPQPVADDGEERLRDEPRADEGQAVDAEPPYAELSGAELRDAEPADGSSADAEPAYGSPADAEPAYAQRSEAEPAGAGPRDAELLDAEPLDAGASEALAEQAPVDEQPVEEPVDEAPAVAPVPAAARRGAVRLSPEQDQPAPRKRGRAAATEQVSTSVAPAPTGRTRAAKAPGTPAKRPAKVPSRAAAPAPSRRAAAGQAVPAAAKAPGTRARSTAAAAAAAAAPAGPGTVVVIPDRGKFHRPECRYVRDVPHTQELSKVQAGRQGYAACGVCRP